MRLTEENYVEVAEKVILELCKRTNTRGEQIDLVTTSQIRNLLAMTADIYNDVINLLSDKLTKEIISKINYLKIRFVYESGRERNENVKKLVKQAQILECIDEIKDSRQNYILFSHYIEALVAYRKYYGKSDK
ncbi:cRISPR-associated protein Csm2 family [Firmicutes bacterium CAG:882]|nr:cRISPR-associated protein Csm2 family [Firmicutes bacterium CAG:882]